MALSRKNAKKNKTLDENILLRSSPRLDVSKRLQTLIDDEFRAGKHVIQFKFHIGQRVIYLHDDFYHKGVIEWYKGSVKNEDVCPPNSSGRLPTYCVRFPKLLVNADDGQQGTVMTVAPENKILARAEDSLINLFGMLYAHEWNIRKCEAVGTPPSDLPVSVWFLDNASYQRINSSWMHVAHEVRDFKDYCGRNFVSRTSCPQ